MLGGVNGKSLGDSFFVFILVRAAAVVGIDGLFVEMYVDFKNVLSDGVNMLKFGELEYLVVDMLKI